jgi:hypothetical protein
MNAHQKPYGRFIGDHLLRVPAFSFTTALCALPAELARESLSLRWNRQGPDRIGTVFPAFNRFGVAPPLFVVLTLFATKCISWSIAAADCHSAIPLGLGVGARLLRVRPGVVRMGRRVPHEEGMAGRESRAVSGRGTNSGARRAQCDSRQAPSVSEGPSSASECRGRAEGGHGNCRRETSTPSGDCALDSGSGSCGHDWLSHGGGLAVMRPGPMGREPASQVAPPSRWRRAGATHSLGAVRLVAWSGPKPPPTT